MSEVSSWASACIASRMWLSSLERRSTSASSRPRRARRATCSTSARVMAIAQKSIGFGRSLSGDGRARQPGALPGRRTPAEGDGASRPSQRAQLDSRDRRCRRSDDGAAGRHVARRHVQGHLRPGAHHRRGGIRSSSTSRITAWLLFVAFAAARPTAPNWSIVAVPRR